MSTPELLTLDETAERVRLSPNTMRRWRAQGIGPNSFRLGPRHIVYSAADLDAWIEAQAAVAGKALVTT